MEFLKKLTNIFSDSENNTTASSSFNTDIKNKDKLNRTIGETEAVCPYCGTELEKKPVRKTKCPHCKNYIFKRTRPYDNRNILVRKEQIDRIEKEWAIANGTLDMYLKGKKEEQEMRNAFRKRYGKEPTEEDLEFRMLNKQVLDAASAGDWGLARNARLKMAKNLEKREKPELALRMLFHVCFLDLNGPNNRGGLPKSIDLRKYPYFTPRSGMLAPGLIKKMRKLINELNFKKDKCELDFIEVTQPVFEGTPTKLPPDETWKSLKIELFNS